MSDERVRIVIADDHLVIREGLRLILETDAGLEVVGEAGDGAEALRAVEQHEPDVLLIDLRMPRMGGIEAIRRIRASRHGVAIVILTTYDDDHLVREGLAAGAQGYLLKDVERETLLRAIRAADDGETLLGDDRVRKALADRTSDGPPIRIEFTPREEQVMKRLVRGDRNREIGDALGITERTVKMHLANVFAKLGVKSRSGAVAEILKYVAREPF